MNAPFTAREMYDAGCARIHVPACLPQTHEADFRSAFGWFCFAVYRRVRIPAAMTLDEAVANIKPCDEALFLSRDDAHRHGAALFPDGLFDVITVQVTPSDRREAA